MKVSSVDTNSLKVSFQGFKQVKDKHGNQNFEFNLPFDEDKYNCYLEVYQLAQDDKGNWFVTDILDNLDTQDGSLLLTSGSNKVDLKSSYFIDEKTPFAYHYKLVDKNTNETSFRVDAGNVIDNRNKAPYEIYNIVTQNGSKLSHGGAMKLIVPDNFNVGYVYNPELFTKEDIKEDKNILEKAQNSFKHFSNKMGGTLAGIEKAIDNGDFDNYSSIISLPIFTDDSLTEHGYWNKNCMQMVHSLGNINNYASLQRKMFAKGLNFVSDGAFVNEGLEGVHFANVLKWGEKSPYFYWFKATGLKNGVFSLGVLGKNQDFISHKIINSPYKYKQKDNGTVRISKNWDYDSSKPTYVQIFDSRLVTEEQKNDNKNLIKTYDILNTDNPYEINTHNDTVINYHFEIDPEVYNKNVENLNEYNSQNDDIIKLDSVDGTRFVNKYENFELEDKIESNFDTWDANTDIAKLNYVYSHADTEAGKNLTAEERAIQNKLMKRGNIEVQDYIVNSGKYWTQKTKDILTLYVAQNLKKTDIQDYKTAYNKIVENVNSKIFSDKLNFDEDVVKNVFDGTYKPNRVLSNDKFKDQIKAGLMNFPLDSVELGDNIVGILASPYITKRATHEDEIGLARYDMYQKGNPHLTEENKRAYLLMQNIYEREMFNFANDIISGVQTKITEDLSNGDNATLYGKYTIPYLTSEIAKFAVIKALQSDAKVFVNDENGEIGYDYSKLKEVSLQTLGIKGASSEDETLSLINKLSKGITKITQQDKELLINALAKSLKDTSAQSFALADMIIDRSEAGLDWRIDATKDIANIDALRDGKDNFDYSFKCVSDFWKKFTGNVLRINRNSYVVAEITDEFDRQQVKQKLLTETGMTAVANYSYFFTDIAMMFGKKFEKDKYEMEFNIDEYFQKRIYEKMIGSENYLRSSDLNSLLYSYTFIGNHDKPRALHCFALDMDLFFANLNDKNNTSLRERAYRVVNDNYFDEVSEKDLKKFDFSAISPKAVAMAESVRTGFIKTLDKLAYEEDYFAKNYTDIFNAVSKSIQDLANGTYLGKNFDAEAFGTKPFDVVIDTVIKNAISQHNLQISDENLEKYKKAVFEAVVEPAYTKLLGAMKYLTALPGKPTLFAGDDLGATGYEEKTKNIYKQNRTYLHNEWKDENDFVKKMNTELNDVMSLRSRPELDALNNGAPFTLPLQKATNGMNVSAILRQSTDGKMAISLFNTAGINHNPYEKYTPQTLKLKGINLNEIRGNVKIGLKGGLKEGMKFVNANDSNDVYFVHKYDDKYVIEHHEKDPIFINDSTLVLYHVPEQNQVSFTGKIDFKPLVGDIVNAYSVIR